MKTATQFTAAQIQAVTDAYLEAVTFTEEAEFEGIEIAPASAKEARADVEKFLVNNAETINCVLNHFYANRRAEGLHQIGTDFWLNRNGHGSGFWDEGWGTLGDQLSDAAHEFGEISTYTTTDGQMYLS